MRPLFFCCCGNGFIAYSLPPLKKLVIALALTSLIHSTCLTNVSFVTNLDTTAVRAPKIERIHQYPSRIRKKTTDPPTPSKPPQHLQSLRSQRLPKTTSYETASPSQNSTTIPPDAEILAEEITADLEADQDLLEAVMDFSLSSTDDGKDEDYQPPESSPKKDSDQEHKNYSPRKKALIKTPKTPNEKELSKKQNKKGPPTRVHQNNPISSQSASDSKGTPPRRKSISLLGPADFKMIRKFHRNHLRWRISPTITALAHLTCFAGTLGHSREVPPNLHLRCGVP